MRMLYLLCLLLALELNLGAQEVCSLIVEIVDPSGRPVSGVPVVLEEQNGRVEPTTVEGGVARFCDLGVLHVTVKVGRPSSCNYTVVQNVPLTWGMSRNLKVA